AVIIGVIIAILAIAALVSFRKWEEWIEAVLGLWLIISPYVLGFTTQMNATVDQVIVGIIVAALAIWPVAGSEAPHAAISEDWNAAATRHSVTCLRCMISTAGGLCSRKPASSRKHHAICEDHGAARGPGLR